MLLYPTLIIYRSLNVQTKLCSNWLGTTEKINHKRKKKDDSYGNKRENSCETSIYKRVYYLETSFKHKESGLCILLVVWLNYFRLKRHTAYLNFYLPSSNHDSVIKKASYEVRNPKVSTINLFRV